MLIRKAYKFRLYPNQEQQDSLARQFGCSRFVYNHFLRQRLGHYAATGKGLSYHTTAKMLTDLKYMEGFEWLQEANAQALQQSLRDLDTAYKNFFDQRAAFPRFKSKHDKQSFRVPQAFRVEGDRLIIQPIQGAVRRGGERWRHEVGRRTRFVAGEAF